jgi:outer membrane murein-binding lipoprotein Lpp
MEDFLRQMIAPMVSAAVAFGGCFAVLKILEKNQEHIAERLQGFMLETCPSEKKRIYDYVNTNVQTLNEKIDKNQDTIMAYLMDIKESIGAIGRK